MAESQGPCTPRRGAWWARGETAAAMRGSVSGVDGSICEGNFTAGLCVDGARRFFCLASSLAFPPKHFVNKPTHSARPARVSEQAHANKLDLEGWAPTRLAAPERARTQQVGFREGPARRVQGLLCGVGCPVAVTAGQHTPGGRIRARVATASHAC